MVNIFEHCHIGYNFTNPDALNKSWNAFAEKEGN
jgi:hypothetical protein